MATRGFHKAFTLNGRAFSSKEALIIFSKTIHKEVYRFLIDWFSNEDSIIVNTSGSTGKPKPIQLKKEFMKNSAIATGNFFNLSAKTTALLCLSPEYIAGKMMLVRALTLGWEIDIIAPVSNPLSLTNKPYDFSAMVPLQLQQALDSIHQIKTLIVGGGVVNTTLQQKIQQVTTKVFATYGMTETITHIAIKPLNHFYETPVFYSTLPKVTIYMDSRHCLAIKAPEISNEFIITNDVVNLVSDTQFEWLGRYDNVINSGGVKLHPEHIEEQLSTIIKQRFFVAGIPDETFGQKLVLIIEADTIDKALLLAEIKTLNLTKYQIPKALYCIPQFIETDTKKIQRIRTLDLIFR